MTPINPDKTIAILVGIEDYIDERLHPLHASFENVSALNSFLLKQVGMNQNRIKRMISSNYSTFLEDISNFIDDKEDVEHILFYYAGHGLPPVLNGEKSVDYYISVSDTVGNNRKINCRDLFNTLRADNNESLIAIFDCCFSGRAIDSLTNREDYLVTTASPGENFANYEPGQVHSTYTGTLLKVLNNGIPNGPEELTFRDIFKHVIELLTLSQAPTPLLATLGPIADTPFIKNPAGEVEEEDDDYYQELLELVNAIVREEKKYFTDVYFKHKLFKEEEPLEKERINKIENFNDPVSLKLLIVKRYPLVISYLLKTFLYPVSNKEIKADFYENMYSQILRLLSYIIIKDLADQKSLKQDFKDLIDVIWEQTNVCRQWHVEVIKKGVMQYSDQLLIKELTQNSDFFKTILYIEYKMFGTLTLETLTALIGKKEQCKLFARFNDRPNGKFNLRNALFNLVKDLVFLVNYNMIAVKLIRVIRGYCRPVNFIHQISNLYCDSPQNYSNQFTSINKCYHNGTVIILPKTADPQELLKEDRYINLWPLVIDKNGACFDNTDKPEIHLFQYAEMEPMEFYYRKAHEEKDMFKGKPQRYNQLIQFPDQEETAEYFKYFKNNLQLND